MSLFRDSNHFFVDQTGDGGDSCVRNGIYSMCADDYGASRMSWLDYYSSAGLRRHPTQVPWNNPKNFSRDQLMCAVPTLFQFQARELLYSAAKRGFFAQNFERDAAGTKKFPWPHKVDGKWRMFDFADPLLPNHIGTLIIRGKVRWLYPLLPICYAFHLLTLVVHGLGNHYEENQMICESTVYRTTGLYKKLRPQWRSVSFDYWESRNEVEYHNMLVKHLGEK